MSHESNNNTRKEADNKVHKRNHSTTNANPAASAILTGAALLLTVLPFSVKGQHHRNNGDGYVEQDLRLIRPQDVASDDAPVGYTYSRKFHWENHQGLIGCLYSEYLCNEDEYCFDDNLFGRCSLHEGEYFKIKPLSRSQMKLFYDKVNQIISLNYPWTDPYAQCLLQVFYDTVPRGFRYDTEICESAFRWQLGGFENTASQPTKDKLLNTQHSLEEGEPFTPDFNIPVRNENNLKDSELGGNLAYDAARNNELNDIFSVERQDDGSLLIGPYETALSKNTLNFADEWHSKSGRPVDKSDSQIGRWNEEEEEEPTLPIVNGDEIYINKPPLNNPIYFQDLANSPEMKEVRDRINNADAEQHLYPQPDYDEGVNSNLLGRATFNGRAGHRGYFVGLDDPPSPAAAAIFWEPSRQPANSNLKEADGNPDEFEDYPTLYAEEYDALGEGDQGMSDDGGLFLFNRNERLDVKKPGPSIPPEESILLEKAIGDGSKYETGGPFGPRSQNYSPNERGQDEYEMPLLAPVKDKRILPVLQMERNENKNGGEESTRKKFVHLLLNNRFNTWNEGSDLINVLANNFGIPQHALADRRIEDHHVQFRVDPNPQEVDAETMVNTLVHGGELQKRISNQLGLDISKASTGQRDGYVTTSTLPGSSEDGRMTTLIFVSASAVIAAIASIAIVVVIIRRKRRNGFMGEPPPQANESGKLQEEYQRLCRDWSRSSKTLDGKDNANCSPIKSVAARKINSQDSKGSERSSTSSWCEEPASNMDISTGHMVLAYMEDHLKNKQRLEQEWVALCSYEAEPCAVTVAFRAENKKKNRHPDKLPYDHNRVILNAVLNASNSDYINASTVSDHDPRNPSYIVTQAPLAQTVADFWQMIWEQGCVVIVMLTKLQDNGYQLCHRYWPEEGSEQYHIFEVHLVSEHVWCEDYLVRSVYLKNTRTGETRTVTQFHFLSWPAQSVPASAKTLLEFRRKVNKSYRGRSCPIAIHCSDGVGRAGTYVLIDMVLTRMAKGCKEIDIAATLEHMRDQRCGMVQTRPQFEFCLMAVAEEVHAILKALLPS